MKLVPRRAQAHRSAESPGGGPGAEAEPPKRLIRRQTSPINDQDVEATQRFKRITAGANQALIGHF
jgi:hypothetical protein